MDRERACDIAPERARAERHRVFTTLSRSTPGRIRDRISLRFKSTSWSASLHSPDAHRQSSTVSQHAHDLWRKRETHRVGSIIGARSATGGPSLPSMFFSQPTAGGFVAVPTVPPAAYLTTMKRFFHPPTEHACSG